MAPVPLLVPIYDDDFFPYRPGAIDRIASAAAPGIARAIIDGHKHVAVVEDIGRLAAMRFETRPQLRGPGVPYASNICVRHPLGRTFERAFFAKMDEVVRAGTVFLHAGEWKKQQWSGCTESRPGVDRNAVSAGCISADQPSDSATRKPAGKKHLQELRQAIRSVRPIKIAMTDESEDWRRSFLPIPQG